MDLKQHTQLQTELTAAYHDYSKILKGYVFSKIRNHSICNDLVQDTFLKTWIYLVKAGKIDSMKAFLFHVLKNLIVDEYRKNKAISLELLEEKGFQLSAGDFRRLYDILDGKKAFLMIPSLPKKYQKVMEMRYVENLTIEDISKIIRQTKNNTTVILFRGLEKLRLLYSTT